MDATIIRDHIVDRLELSERWRRDKAEEYPDDARNIRAAETLRHVIAMLRATDPDTTTIDGFDRIVELASALRIDDDPMLWLWGERTSRAASRFGFSRLVQEPGAGGPVNQLLHDLADAMLDDLAERLHDDLVDEVPVRIEVDERLRALLGVKRMRLVDDARIPTFDERPTAEEVYTDEISSAFRRADDLVASQLHDLDNGYMDTPVLGLVVRAYARANEEALESLSRQMSRIASELLD